MGDVIPLPTAERFRTLPYRYHASAPPLHTDRAYREWQIEIQLYFVLDELPVDEALASVAGMNPGLTVEALETLLDLSETAYLAEINGSRDYFHACVDEYLEHLQALARQS